MVNPEFKRNLWLSFSAHRLIAMPVVLGLCFLAAGSGSESKLAERLYTTACTLFVFIIWLWGTRRASSSIVDELRDKTWDQQRMSALQPWAMTWGKLFGATSFNWYGAAICLAVAILAGFGVDETVVPQLLAMLAVGVLLHAKVIALNLHSSRTESRLVERGGHAWIAIALSLMLLGYASNITKQQTLSWWGIEFSMMWFLFGSALLFAACAVFAAWRVMCNALQVRTLPWAWPLFALILSAYIAGLPDGERMNGRTFSAILLSVSVVMTYGVLITEPTGLMVWRQLERRRALDDWRGWFEQLPLWPTTLVLSFAAAVVMTMQATSVRGNTFFMPFEGAVPLVIALALLRDVCVYLFFSCSPNPRRVLATTVLYLLLINGLFPYLAHSMGLHGAAQLFLPVGDIQPLMAVLVMAFHAAVALALVVWRIGAEKSRQGLS